MVFLLSDPFGRPMVGWLVGYLNLILKDKVLFDRGQPVLKLFFDSIAMIGDDSVVIAMFVWICFVKLLRLLYMRI